MREHVNGRRIGQVIGGYVHGLNGGDGARGGVRDALLETGQLGAHRGLIPQARRHLPEQTRDLHASLNEPEYIVYEQGWLRDNERETIRRYLEGGAFGLEDRRGAFYLLKRGADAARNGEVLASLR